MGQQTAAGHWGGDEGNSAGIALLALGAAFLTVLLPGLANLVWPESRATHDLPPLARVIEDPRSFETVWDDARSTLSSLHPPPGPEAGRTAVVEPAPAPLEPIVKVAPAASANANAPASEPQVAPGVSSEAVEPAPPHRRRVAAAIPRPPERPAPPPTLAAEPAPAAAAVPRERTRVLGVDLPTLEDATRLLDDAAALAGSVTRHLPRI